MSKLDQIRPGTVLHGILSEPVTVVDVNRHSKDVMTLTYKDMSGHVSQQLLFDSSDNNIEIVEDGPKYGFNGNASIFRMVSEARRIQLAYLFDPLLAVNTSLVDPLPHQITAVYETMLQRQPLRFLLADDPGSGKTIMAGLLIKELIARGDVQRCMIVSPGNLVEQWQDELYSKFNLNFEIMTNDKLESSRTGNWFMENPFAICRLDKLSRNDDIKAKLEATEWDLIICDEAHKMSASYFGGEANYTKRYLLGQLLSRITRHFLLMTATPHNGKEEDFHLFLRLLDSDRFEGKFRGGPNKADTSDIMRRMLKEQLLKFDGTPLFPERIAYTVNYTLSPGENQLYQMVTDYVRDEFNRADKLDNEKRKRNVGFALTILQRRLASSPAAIYKSIHRRLQKLEEKLKEERHPHKEREIPDYNIDDIEDIDDLPVEEAEKIQNELTDKSTAARTIEELQAEIDSLKHIESLAHQILVSKKDRKWEELSSLLQDNKEMFDSTGSRRKLIIFTEHRDTLDYLVDRMRQLLGRNEAVVMIHGGMGRELRKKAELSFTQDKDVIALIATDAAGEGVNLQRAHLMINYDLPWNPNRIEQRFGRIHRIGQTEVCHLWNLVASETREGWVYNRLLEKLEEERKALGGQVFDVLGSLRFDNKPLRDLLIEAIRYGDKPEVKERLNHVMENAIDRNKLRELIEARALASDSMDTSKVRKIREDFERAEARKLQPHYIASFFINAFTHLGGTIREREKGRYEITHIPLAIKSRNTGAREPVLDKYQRVTFDKSLISVQGKPLATFICPGHPLLNATINILMEKYREVLMKGTILVDPADFSTEPRLMVTLEHAIQDAHIVSSGQRRVISKRLQFVEMRHDGSMVSAGYAPYLDYRQPEPEEKALIGKNGIPTWMQGDVKDRIYQYAIVNLVKDHLDEVKRQREAQIDKTMLEVRDRLTKEINYWDFRAVQLREQEQAGKGSNMMNSANAAKKAEELSARLQRRMKELEEERKISSLPPVISGMSMIVPIGLIQQLKGENNVNTFAKETERVEAIAMNAVMETERKLGFIPRDVSKLNQGWDIESSIPGTGRLRLIEVKGRVKGATTVTVSRNEILRAMNKPDSFILALVEINGEEASVKYVRQPFVIEPDFNATSVNYDLKEMLAKAMEPC